ncbi:hypothetical protein RDWZM_004164 [Blomia tropicalis]|uniref:2-deoxyglucose-6-phosphate phosphatase n=1 Tax=Blomia tropicalis TaxID=40697 RepID=A0A9Q0MHK8_BLOTA|nr:hypothetical protein RDWZM_004164 [Blomia tropicalis]
MITHVLFDFDGTLVNSIDRIIEEVDQIIQKHSPNSRINKKIRDYIPNLTSFQNIVALVNSDFNLSLNLDEYAEKIGHDSRINLKLMPGVEKLVQHLYKNNIPMAVATGAGSVNYNLGVSNFPEFFAKHFSHSVCAYDDPDVKNRKPAPDCYLIACQRFAKPPSDMKNVLIFEDSFTGLKGAIASGGKTVYVSKFDRPSDQRELLDKTDLDIETLDQFKPEDFGLPPYEQ